jgi:hypothetical protein
MTNTDALTTITEPVLGSIERDGKHFATLSTFVPLRVVIDPGSSLGGLLLDTPGMWHTGLEDMMLVMLSMGNENSSGSIDAEALVRGEWRCGN